MGVSKWEGGFNSLQVPFNTIPFQQFPTYLVYKQVQLNRQGFGDYLPLPEPKEMALRSGVRKEGNIKIT